MSVDYLLHESSVGYAVFKVIHQADTIGNRLKEVQDSVQVLCCIGKSRRDADHSIGSSKIWQDGQACQLCAFPVSFQSYASKHSY